MSESERVINMLTQAEVAAAAAAAMAANAGVGAATNSLQFATDEQRHMAIASIFNSLSSFAAANQQQASSHKHVSPLEARDPLIQQYRHSPEHPAPLAIPGQLQSFATSTNPRQPATAQIRTDLSPPPVVGPAQCQQQRINYCTICNKELCNKYFMKTHMLKMHGINLEMEQSAHTGDNEQQNQLTDPSAAHDQTQHQKEATHGRSDGAQSETNKQKTTSVLNGFAGNSMGGVVCDICNKELCSKYFLKVHKQNTHGIVTDQLDAASQSLMYPLAAQLAAAAAAAAAAGGSAGMFTPPLQTSTACMPTTMIPNAPPLVTTNTTSPSSSSRKPKKPRLSAKANIGQTSQTSLFGDSDQPMVGQVGMANPLTTFMCLGAIGGHTGLSPALVVDNILRNQHLTGGSAKLKGRSNNNSNQSPVATKTDVKSDATSSSSASSGSSGARYFSHYTEACPMCDRRFKSIKWLKTHMMNDHKQEIAAYMHMMLQYINYSSRATNQQVATAMAAAAATAKTSNQFAHKQSMGQQMPTNHPVQSPEHPNLFNMAPFGLNQAMTATFMANQNQQFGYSLGGSQPPGFGFNPTLSQPTTHIAAQNYLDQRYQQQLLASTIGQHQARSTFCTLPADYVIHSRHKNPQPPISLQDHHEVESPASDLSLSGSELNFEPVSLGMVSDCGIENDLQLDLSRQPDSPASSENEASEGESEGDKKPLASLSK